MVADAVFMAWTAEEVSAVDEAVVWELVSCAEEMVWDRVAAALTSVLMAVTTSPVLWSMDVFTTWSLTTDSVLISPVELTLARVLVAVLIEVMELSLLMVVMDVSLWMVVVVEVIVSV